MLRNKRLLFLSFILFSLAGAVLGLKLGYPHNRLIAGLLWIASWIPLIISFRSNRQMIRRGKILIKRKGKPYLPHTIVALVLLAGFYAGRVLVPVETSPLIRLSEEELKQVIAEDLENYLMLREAADDVTGQFNENGLLGRDVESLNDEQRLMIRRVWRDGVMAFLEADMLKEKYRGFMQIDYAARPARHADAFFIAFASYICQYNACLNIADMVGDNPWMETLLNETGDGIPADSYFVMKQRLTHPEVILRVHAGSAYYELVKNAMTISPGLKEDFEQRRRSFFKQLGNSPEIFFKNPLEVIERKAFDAWFPVQKNIAVQMSYIRTVDREYFITPEILAEHRGRLKPGDILVERRNWHMTNIGIPGFWPHVALYVGTLEEIDAAFDQLGFIASDQIREQFPDVYEALQQKDEEGYPLCVMESIRPGVIFQSLERSAKCDYLGAVRPELPQQEKFNALLSAFSNYRKPYDLNFDFATENELVCSELVYKAFQSSGELPFKPEIINGRLLLPPNRMVEQMVKHLNDKFAFLLFLDASEKNGTVNEAGSAAFSKSWERPKWDVLQK